MKIYFSVSLDAIPVHRDKHRK